MTQPQQSPVSDRGPHRTELRRFPADPVRCPYRPKVRLGWTILAGLAAAWVYVFTVPSGLPIGVGGYFVLVVCVGVVYAGAIAPIVTRLRRDELVLDQERLSLPGRAPPIPVVELRRARVVNGKTLRIDHSAGFYEKACSVLDRDAISPLVETISRVASESAAKAHSDGADGAGFHWERVPPNFEWVPVRTVRSVDDLPEDLPEPMRERAAELLGRSTDDAPEDPRSS